jgi:hypothetical protein
MPGLLGLCRAFFTPSNLKCVMEKFAPIDFTNILSATKIIWEQVDEIPAEIDFEMSTSFGALKFKGDSEVYMLARKDPYQDPHLRLCDWKLNGDWIKWRNAENEPLYFRAIDVSWADPKHVYGEGIPRQYSIEGDSWREARMPLMEFTIYREACPEYAKKVISMYANYIGNKSTLTFREKLILKCYDLSPELAIQKADDLLFALAEEAIRK